MTFTQFVSFDAFYENQMAMEPTTNLKTGGFLKLTVVKATKFLLDLSYSLKTQKGGAKYCIINVCKYDKYLYTSTKYKRLFNMTQIYLPKTCSFIYRHITKCLKKLR